MSENKEYARAYYHKNKERFKEYHKQWWLKNRDYYLEKRRKEQLRTLGKQVVVYSVWNNATDEVVIIDGTPAECSRAMGISVQSFHSLVTRTRQGKHQKWTFEKNVIRRMEGE